MHAHVVAGQGSTRHAQVKMPPNSVLFEEGSPADALIWVHAGSVKLYTSVGDHAARANPAALTHALCATQSKWVAGPCGRRASAG
jgi:hypothetical protein